MHALGLGEADPERRMYDVLVRAAADDHVARIGARTLLRFVFGHVIETAGQPEDEDFHLGLTLVLDGLCQRVG